MGRRGAGLAALVAGALLAPAAPAWAAFADVPGGYWAKSSIVYVAQDRNWMRDYGSDEFRPESRLLRRHLARAVVRAFAPGEPVDSSITFSDLPPENYWYRYANVAVKKGWMRARDGAFVSAGTVTKIDLDRALVLALGLRGEVRGLDRIQTSDGARFARPSGFPYLVLGESLRLHHNHGAGAEWREILPGSEVLRADAAYALHRAALAAGTWRVSSLERFESVVLPVMTTARRRATEFALKYAGYPYVYAGEWYRPTPDGYCCGDQPQGGFDCSGYAWWVLRAPGDGWDNTSVRPYHGWALPERASRYMAKNAPKRLAFSTTKAMDLLFYDSDGAGDGWEAVDHVGLSLGGGWMIHSAGGSGGVVIDWVADGWWAERYVWGRKVIT